ncbi:copper homeostasis protein, partial [Mycoplasma putrefaciens]
MYLQVVGASIDDIKQINQSNADSIAFCKNPEVGGLTPSLDDILLANQVVQKPINIMIRTSEHGFVFTEYELKKQIRTIEMISELANISGIVVGVLNDDFSINEKFLEEVNKVKKHLKVTFHQAFDQAKDFKKALKILEKYKVDLVLTSIGINPEQDLEVLKELKNLKTSVEILITGLTVKDHLKQALTVSKDFQIDLIARVEPNW